MHLKHLLAGTLCCALASGAGAATACAATPGQPAGTSAKHDSVTITLSAAGDCTLGTDAGFGGNTFTAVYNRVKKPSYFLKNVKKIFAADDLTFVNLEGTLTKRGSRATKTFAFRGKPSYTKILSAGSIEAVGFANNHDHDYGTVSFTDTKRYVKRAGIKLASYGTVSTYTAKGVKVGMVAVNSVGPSVESAKGYVKRGLAKLKKKGCAVRVVMMHAGVEKKHYPAGDQKSIARYAVRQGADLVLGAHPHVLQGVERYKGVYIVYSLGNFCFGGNSNPADKDTMIFQKTFTVKDGKLKRDKAAKVIPCSVSSKTGYNDYRPTPLKGASKTRVIKRINAYSKAFGVSFKNSGAVR